MLGQAWGLFVILFLLAGGFYGQKVLFVLGIMLALGHLLMVFWSRWSLWRLEFSRTLSERRAFVGETVEMTIRIANRKPLPVTWLEMREEIAEELSVEGAKIMPSPKMVVKYIAEDTSLAWYEAVTWRYRLLCSRRGYFRIGPTNVRTGDVFGLVPRRLTVPESDYFLVYPQTIPLRDLGLPERRPFGETRAKERIFEDPVRVLGLREYRSDDPFKRIDWKATARHQELQVKVYEPTTSIYLQIFLNIDTFEHSWQGYYPEVLERGVTAAASVAQYGWEHFWSVGILANGSVPGSDRPIKVYPSRAPEQLLRVLEALALVSPFTTSSIDALIKEEGRRIPWGSTVVIVSAIATEGLWAEMARLREAGHLVALLYCGNGPTPVSRAGVPVYNVAYFLRERDKSLGEGEATLRQAQGRLSPLQDRPFDPSTGLRAGSAQDKESAV